MTRSICDKLIMATAGLIIPLQDVFIAVIILIVADWITGIWKSIKYHRRLTSWRFRASITKLVTYLMAIYLGAVFNDMLIPDFHINLASYVAAYIGLTELVSIYENIAVITNKALMSEIAAAIKKAVKSKLNKTTTDV